MAELKTKRTQASVADFLDGIEDARKRADARTVAALMQEATGEAPAMWGPGIVGFGRCHLRYESGRELDWMLVGFSPRKAALTLYIMPGFAEYEELLARLGKVSIGKSCLYLKTLVGIDQAVLRELVTRSVEHMRQQHATG